MRAHSGRARADIYSILYSVVQRQHRCAKLTSMSRGRWRTSAWRRGHRTSGTSGSDPIGGCRSKARYWGPWKPKSRSLQCAMNSCFVRIGMTAAAVDMADVGGFARYFRRLQGSTCPAGAEVVASPGVASDQPILGARADHCFPVRSGTRSRGRCRPHPTQEPSALETGLRGKGYFPSLACSLASVRSAYNSGALGSSPPRASPSS